MLSRLLLFVVFIVVPAIEIALFIVVGEAIGVLPTVLLVFATAIVGTGLARRQGFETLQRLRAQVDRGEMPGEEIGNAVTIVFAGLLLITPGFFTDALGFVLFVPAVRRAMWRRMRAALRPVIVTSGDAGGGAPGRRPSPDGPVIDLDEDEFGPPRDDTPWRPGEEPPRRLGDGSG